MHLFSPHESRQPIHNVRPLGHKCENVLVSGFEEGLDGGIRAEKVERAVNCGTLLVDKSHYGVICVQGQDRMRFLHSQGTNAFDGARKGIHAGVIGSVYYS